MAIVAETQSENIIQLAHGNSLLVVHDWGLVQNHELSSSLEKVIGKHARFLLHRLLDEACVNPFYRHEPSRDLR